MGEADNMRDLLKAEVVPLLREMGFRGSFPHFNRERGDHVDLVWFTFSSAGTSFAVELSFADSARTNVRCNPDAAPGQLRVASTTQRHRLGAGEAMDHWYAFVGVPWRGMAGHPDDLVADVKRRLPLEGEEWWRAQGGAS